MYQKILVPLDGKPENEAALAYALELARGFDGTLILLSAVPHRVHPPARFSIAEPEPWLLYQRKKKQEAVDYLNELSRRPELNTVKFQRVIGEGPAHDIILRAIEEHEVDLVIMTKKRRHRLVRWIVGSNPLRVLRESPVPVLLVTT